MSYQKRNMLLIKILILLKKLVCKQAISIKDELNELLKLKRVSKASASVINFLNDSIIKIIKNNNVNIENNSINTDNSISKKTHIKLFDNTPKHKIQIDKVYIDLDKCKKAHKKLFNIVLKQITQVNKVYIQANSTCIDLDNCKKADDVLKEITQANDMNIQTNDVLKQVTQAK